MEWCYSCCCVGVGLCVCVCWGGGGEGGGHWDIVVVSSNPEGIRKQ